MIDQSIYDYAMLKQLSIINDKEWEMFFLNLEF